MLDRGTRVERRFTTDDGIDLFYAEYGPRDGTPVVICHGIAVNSTQFTEDAEYFAARGYRVLTPDLRGHGRSGIASPHRANYLLERLALDQTQMLDHAGIGKAHWVGNSLGGMVGLTLVARHADRLLSLATFGTPYRMHLPAPGIRPFVSLNFAVWRPLIVKTAAALCSPDPAVRQRIEAMAINADAGVMGAVATALTSYDHIETIASAPVPVLLLHCHRDHLLGWGMSRTLSRARGMPNLRFVDLPEGGHCANLDVPEQVRSALLAFWQAH
ncbi:MAG TPA: alpha/beta hydrolase [Devosia sp.]|nr:alpha/beta hydrolase [Devosia sp.]